MRLSDVLNANGMGLILDIVPNHMGVGGADNACWLSVLEWGELSPVANMFDVDWHRLGAGGKLVVPFLGSRYGVALEAGELQLRFDAEEGTFSVWHWEHRFPVCPFDYPDVIDRALAALGEIDSGTELLAVAEILRAMATETAPERRSAFPEETKALKARIAEASASPDVKDAIERAVVLFNGVSGTPESFGSLHRLLEVQNYRLAHWRVAASDINYRRFFDINSLGGIRVEEPDVFARTHELIFRLVREGRVQGLRVDHVDGLADPEGYTQALQREIGPDFYILIEKILEPGEALRPWPVAGTTGYDVLNVIDGVFVDTRNARRFEAIYRVASGVDTGYGTQLRAAKEEIVETSFASELEVLVSDLKRIADVDRSTRDYTTVALRRALTEIVARLPVYRTYITEDGAIPTPPTALCCSARCGRPKMEHSARSLGPRFHSLGDTRRRRHRRARPRRAGRCRAVPSPLSAAHRAGPGQEPRRHVVLSLCTVDLAQRSRRRSRPFRIAGGGLPRIQHRARTRLAACHDRDRDTRHETRRGRACAAQCPVGDARHLGARARHMARDVGEACHGDRGRSGAGCE